MYDYDFSKIKCPNCGNEYKINLDQELNPVDARAARLEREIEFDKKFYKISGDFKLHDDLYRVSYNAHLLACRQCGVLSMHFDKFNDGTSWDNE